MTEEEMLARYNELLKKDRTEGLDESEKEEIRQLRIHLKVIPRFMPR